MNKSRFTGSFLIYADLSGWPGLNDATLESEVAAISENRGKAVIWENVFITRSDTFSTFFEKLLKRVGSMAEIGR